MPSCIRTITELKAIKFKEHHANEYSTTAIVGADHAVDALRYLAMSRLKTKTHERNWLKDWQQGQKTQERAKYLRRFDGPLIGSTPARFAEAR